MHEAENLRPNKSSKLHTRFHSNTPGAKTKLRPDAQVYLKPRPKTDFYLVFALALLFMTMVFMG